MKKLILFSLIVAFALVGAQAFASPPVAPPPEGFIITSTTDISCTGDVVENERYNWTYFEGWGTGPFYPNGYVPVGATNCNFTGECPPGPNNNYAVNELGFSAGAEIAYQQSFKAIDGVTDFYKTFEAYSHPDAAAGQENLMVHKEITYTATDPAKGYAEHTEKVGLSVVSMGKAGSSAIDNPAEGLLSLCPWAASSGGSADGGYPATNEGIAAGSHFKVTAIQGFTSDSLVNSTALPMLSYNVTAMSGTGLIEAGFVVDLWEAPKGFVWEPAVASENCIDCDCCGCNPRTQDGGPWILPQAYGPPPLASRTSYKEYASADGTWSFTKSVKYQSVMPSGASSATFPIDQVLVP
jgi:hypothetical protein